MHHQVHKERKMLADEGFVSLIFTINKKKETRAETQIITKGFADTQVKETNQIINLILDRANTNFKNALAKQKTLNINSLKNTLIQTLKPYIYMKLQKNTL